jgi:hypothetical protein
VQYYSVHKCAVEIEDIVFVMSPHFSSKPGTYYSDALFFLSLGLHRIASTNQDLAVILDADTKFKVDVKELFKEFDNFGKEALFGLGPELTPVYRHVLYIYRSKNPKTNFGEPSYLGGYAGYNSGVVLLNLKRLRESLEYDQIVSQDSVEHMVDKYNFKVIFIALIYLILKYKNQLLFFMFCTLKISEVISFQFLVMPDKIQLIVL